MTEIKVKRTAKDSVFTDLFSDKKNVLKLYKVLHAEDQEVTEDDIKYLTIENVLVNGIYNDLGFMIADRLIILVEAQSTWTVNILVRSFLYLATTYKRYLEENKSDYYDSKKVFLPEPELYVIYTGDKKKVPDEINLSDEFFGGRSTALDVKIKVIHREEDGIIGEYVTFCKVLNGQIKKYGYTEKAIEETIRICKDKDVLREYLEGRELEVTTMLKTLYDEEYLREIHIKNLLRENTEEVTEKVTIEVTSEVTDTHIRSAVKVFRDMDMSSEEITAKLMEMFGIDKKQAAEYAE